MRLRQVYDYEYTGNLKNVENNNEEEVVVDESLFANLNLSATKPIPKYRSKMKDKRREITMSLTWVLASLSKF